MTSLPQKVAVSLGTATPGGGFPVYGQAFTDTINEIEPTLEVKPQNTKGSTENIPLLEAGKIDLGLVQGEAALEALNGIGRPPADLRILTAMYATPGMFVVRADSAYRTIDDLKGKPVAFGAKGSGLVILARYVLDGLGIDRDKDFEAIFLDKAGDGPEMVMSGKAAALWGAGVGWPGFHGRRQGPRRRALHRARRRRHQAHPGQAPVPEDADGAGRHLRGTDRADRLRGLLELRAGPADAARRHRLQARPRAAQGRGGDRQAPRAGQRDDGRQYGRGCPKRELIHPGVLRYLTEIGLVK